MTENVTTVTGVGATLPSNTTIGADNVSGVYYERVKIAQGDTGTAVDVSSGAPLWVNVNSGSITVSSNAVFTVTTSTGTIGAVLQGTTPWSVSPSSQWTVSVTPTSAIPVTGSFAVSSSTLPIGGVYLSSSPSTGTPFIIGSVAPSSQWTITTTPSSQATVSVQPTTQWTVSVTPTTQFTVTTTPSSQQTVATSSTTTVQGTVVTIPSSQATVSVQPTTQWTVTTTPSTTLNVVTSPSSQATVSVQPTTQFTVTTTPSSQITASVQPTTQWQVSAIPDTNLIMNGTSSLTPVIVPIATLSSSGLSAVVTAPTSGTIRVTSMFLVAANAVNIQWMSSSTTTTTSSVWTGITALSSNAGYVLPYNPLGWFATTTGTGINGLYANLSAAVQVGGSLTYINV